MQIRTIGYPKQAQLGVAGSVAASIISGVTSVLMTTVQIIYTEIQEARARKQWRHDRASAAAELQVRVDELNQQNTDLQDYLNSIMTGETPVPGSSPAQTAVLGFMASPLMPYIVVGGGVGLLLLLRGRKS